MTRADRGWRWAVWLRCLLALVLLGRAAPLQAAPGDIEAETRRRCDRGFRLAGEGDFAGAAAEYRRAFELSGETEPLFNLGVLLAKLNRSAQVVTTLDQLLREPKGLPQPSLDRARRIRDEHAARVGQLRLASNVPAQIEIDNLDVGRTPLTQPLVLTTGTHLLTVTAPGYTPLRRQVEIVAGEIATLSVTLASADGRLAGLRIKSPLPGAEVLLDGKPIGRTPLPGTTIVTPGRHEIALRREGYQPVDQMVQVGDGGSEEINLVPDLALAEAAASSARLKLQLSEPGASVSLDGKLRRLPPSGLALPVGPHLISVERTGFLPYQREVTLNGPGEHLVQITLEPTEETRYEHQQTASRQRWRAYLTLGAGVLVAGGGGWLWSRAQRESNEAQRDYDDVARSTLGPDGECYRGGGAMIDVDACQSRIDRVNARSVDAETQLRVAKITTAAGLAITATGLVLRLLAEDPQKYEAGEFQLLGFADAGLALHKRF